MKISQVSKTSNKVSFKKKLLETYEAELNPMEAFKFFLLETIKSKSSHQKPSNEMHANANLSQHSNNFPKQSKEYQREDEELSRIIQEKKEKNQSLIKSCKKMKQKLRLDKQDRAMKFHQLKMQPFSDLKTFIDAKEFLQKINPVKFESNFHSNQYKQDKGIHTLKKLHRQSITFFDNKNKEFLARIEELNKLKTEKNKKNEDSSPSSLSSVNSETRNNSPINSPTNRFPGKTQLKIQKNISNELKKPKNIIKNNKDGENLKKFKAHLKIPIEKIKKQLMKNLMHSDESLNKKDFEVENSNFFNCNSDEFYSNLLRDFEKQKKIKYSTPLNIDKDLESLMRLEKVVGSIIEQQENYEESLKKSESLEQFKEFHEKTSEIIKLIGQTSRKILYSDDKTTNSLNHRKSILQRNRFSQDFTKSIDLQSSLTSQVSKLNIDQIKNNEKFFDVPKKHSIFLPKNSILTENRDPSRISQIGNEISGKLPSIIEKNNMDLDNDKVTMKKHSKNLSLSPFYSPKNNGNDTLVFPQDKKELTINKLSNAPNEKCKSLCSPLNLNLKKKAILIEKFDEIIKKTDELKKNCSGLLSKKDLQKVTATSHDFFSETNKKIHSTLESLVLTLDKPNYGNSYKIPLFMKSLNKKKKKPLIIL